ncbi:MAG: hypothetical protein N2315_01405 [Thermanaerothrix sp.]|nr:hypothetical protein [Thermanaerothrix sp.]
MEVWCVVMGIRGKMMLTILLPVSLVMIGLSCYLGFSARSMAMEDGVRGATSDVLGVASEAGSCLGGLISAAEAMGAAIGG